MCFLVSGLSQASGIRLVYEPAYIKSKQFITADFPWSRLTVVPLVLQLPAPESSNLDPWLLGAGQPVVTPWAPLPPKQTPNLAFLTFLFAFPVIIPARWLQSQTLHKGCSCITWAVMVHSLSFTHRFLLYVPCFLGWLHYDQYMCFFPDILHIPYSMFKIAASTNQSKQPSLLCEMMKNINYVVFKQMVKSFLIRLQGPVCVYAPCKIFVIPGSVGLYNVLCRFNWVVSMPCLGWGIWHRHTHIYADRCIYKLQWKC